MRRSLMAASLVVSMTMGAGTASAQMSVEKRAFTYLADVFVTRIASMEVCNRHDMAKKLSQVMAQYLTKVMGWPLELSLQRVHNAKQPYLRTFRGWKSSPDERRQRVYRTLFSAESCKSMARWTSFEQGFLKGRYRKLP